MPALTWPRSLRWSERDMRPLTLRLDLRSHDFTRREVAGPYWPSTEVFRPTRPRKSWSTRTSRPAIPWRRLRSPSVRRLASAVPAGSATPTVSTATTSVRQRDKTTIPFFTPPAGLAVGLAREDRATPLIGVAIRPRPRFPWANCSGSPAPVRPPRPRRIRRYVPFRRAAL